MSDENKKTEPQEIDVIVYTDANGNKTKITKVEHHKQGAEKGYSLECMDKLWENKVKRHKAQESNKNGAKALEKITNDKTIRDSRKSDKEAIREDFKENQPEKYAFLFFKERSKMLNELGKETDEAKKKVLEEKIKKHLDDNLEWIENNKEVYNKVKEEVMKKMTANSFSMNKENVARSVEQEGNNDFAMKVVKANNEVQNTEKNQEERQAEAKMKIEKMRARIKEGKEEVKPQMKIVARNEDKIKPMGEKKYYADMKILPKEEKESENKDKVIGRENMSVVIKKARERA